MAEINAVGLPVADATVKHEVKVNETVLNKDTSDLEATHYIGAAPGEAGAALDGQPTSPKKDHETEPASTEPALPPDSSRAKGALQQTIGSTKEAIGELLHMEGLRKAGEEQRKEGEMREALALRKQAGAGPLDAVETKIRKAAKVLKEGRERKSSVSDGTGERRSSISSAEGETGPKEPLPGTNPALDPKIDDPALLAHNAAADEVGVGTKDFGGAQGKQEPVV